MAETDLNIILRVVDEATEPIKTSLSGINQETRKLEETSSKAGKTIQKEFSEAGRSLRSFRQAMIPVGITLALIIKTTKDWAETNQETKEAYDRLGKAIKGISASIGSIFAPAIVSLSKLVEESTIFLDGLFNTLRDGYSKLFETISFGVQFNVAFFTSLKEGTGVVNSYRDAMQIATQATREMQQEFDAALGRGTTAPIMDLGKITIEKQKTKESTEEAKKYKTAIEGVAFALGELGPALDAAAAENSKFAKSAAAIALAMAVINTAQGVTKALADWAWPFSMVVAGIIAAAGAIQIATISATKFHDGGIIRAHNGLAIDEVPIIAQTGERVLSRRQVSSLGGQGGIDNLLSGGGGGDIYVTVNYPKMTSREEISQLVGVLGQEIDRQLRYARGN